MQLVGVMHMLTQMLSEMGSMRILVGSMHMRLGAKHLLAELGWLRIQEQSCMQTSVEVAAS